MENIGTRLCFLMAIISASRRTDIPAFHGEWFSLQLREGRVSWRNPFGGRLCAASLLPQDVEAFVFWSKNFAPFLSVLGRIEDSYRSVFQFTITGLPQIFEPNVPSADRTIRTAHDLARRYGPETLLWRYDPILISDLTDAAYHRRKFRELASQMEGATRRCYFSFPTFYAKTLRNTAMLAEHTGVNCRDIPVEERLEIALELAETAAQFGMEMYSCCGNSIVGGRIQKAHCIDAELLAKIFPDHVNEHTIRPTRAECGCSESVDIGSYNTCRHLCVYCYANAPSRII